MTGALGALVGVLAAAGVVMTMRGLFGVTPSLEDFAARLDVDDRPRAEERGWWPAGHDPALAAQLELVGWTRDQWRLQRLQFMAAVSGFAAVLTGMLILVGFAAPWMTAPAVLVGGIAGWWLSLAHLREQADQVRAEASATVAVFLTLVQALMAAGSGPNGAMAAAVLAGRGQVFGLMREAMTTAQLNNTEPWVGLGDLGRRVDIPELVGLAASLRQAGEGASVGDSLVAKAQSLRDRDRYRREAEMVAKGESMSLPLVGMALAFVVLIGYPAVALLLAT